MVRQKESKTSEQKVPDSALNWIDGIESLPLSGGLFEKVNPADGSRICQVARSQSKDVTVAVKVAKRTQNQWAETPPVQRGLILHDMVQKMIKYKDEIARIVALETGKSFNDALGETGGAIQCGLFYASEGQRLYGRTTTSGASNKYASTIRCPVGVAGLIIAANTPIANVAWKVFPALICGNAVVLKAAEDTPLTAWIFGRIAHETDLPKGVLNIIQGYGEEAGASLVENSDVDLISFTGSTEVGKFIQRKVGERLAKVSLELGGKNALVVCEDAHLDNAVKWVLLSAFSNAGQRCASGSRIIIFESVYDRFKTKLIEATSKLRVGTTNDDDLGPVINRKQLRNMLEYVNKAIESGAKVLVGGTQLNDEEHKNGFFMAPTLIENVDQNDDISKVELFGPIAILYKAKDYHDALEQVNDNPYGLTASIHTGCLHRATHFVQNARVGVVVVNAGTFGSEPHMPFGGYKDSGNGTREPGTEALDVYSELKDVYINIDPTNL